MNRSTPGLPVHHQLPEFTQTHVHRVGLCCCCCCWVTSSCPTLCDPIDSSPPGSPVPGILQARTPEWVAISFSNAWKWKVKVKSLSCVQLLATPWTAGSSIHGIFQARVLEWGASAFSRVGLQTLAKKKKDQQHAGLLEEKGNLCSFQLLQVRGLSTVVFLDSPAFRAECNHSLC